MGDLMTCDDAEALLAALAVGSLDQAEARHLQVHLTSCPPCRREAAAYACTVRHLPLALEPVAPPDTLRTRLLATVYAEAARRSTPPVRARSSWRQRLWLAIPANRFWTLGGVVAGTTAIATAAWAALASRPPSTPRSTTSVIVSGTLAQPHAHALLRWDSDSSDAVLTADGLEPTASAGESAPTYEVWLIGANDRPQPAGYLTAAPLSGHWTGAFEGNLHRYRAVAVTLEPTTGRLTPAGTEVLRADLTGIP